MGSAINGHIAALIGSGALGAVGAVPKSNPSAPITPASGTNSQDAKKRIAMGMFGLSVPGLGAPAQNAQTDSKTILGG